MKYLISLITALFVMGIAFLYPVTTAHAVTTITYNENPSDTDTYFWFCQTYGGTSKSFYWCYPASMNVQVDTYTSNGFTYYDLVGNYTCPTNWWNMRTGTNYSGRSSSGLGLIAINHETGEIHAFRWDDTTEIDLYQDGRAVASYDIRSDNTFYAYDFVNNGGLTWQSNIPEPNPLDLDVTFTPTLSGEVSRSTVVNGINYTSDTFNMAVTNNGQNAQFAMFIVPQGDSITIPSLQWSTSDIYSGNPVFVYVKDEWIYDSLTFDALNSSSAFKPSCLHYLAAGQTMSYDIAWSSMKLTPNTSYDVVVYGAVSDSPDYVSLNTSLEYEEVYRSTFSMSSVATFNPDNDLTDNYSWDNSKDNKELFTISKATQDNWGNFAVNNNGGKWYGSSNINSSLNTNQAFGTFFSFFSSVLSFFPAQYLTLIFIGLSALIVIGIIKAVSK